MRHSTKVGLLMVLGVVAVSASIAVWFWGDEPSYGERSLSQWRKQLDHQDSATRKEAAEAIGEIGPSALSALNDLVERLSDTDSEVRSTAARAVGRIGVKARHARPGLVKLLNDPRETVRFSAISGLVGLGPAAIPELMEALQTASPSSRAYAACKLAQSTEQGPLSPVFVAAVASQYGAHAAQVYSEALVERDDETRLVALDSVGRGKASWENVLPRVIAMTNHVDVRIRCAALRAIGRIGSNQAGALEASTTALADSVPEVRASAAHALNGLGRSAAAAVPQLIRCLDDGDPGVRSATFLALGAIGPGAKEAVEPLIEKSRPGSSNRIDALRVLGQIGPHASDALPNVLQALADPGDNLRAVAARALRTVGTAESVSPTLLKALNDNKQEVRTQSALSLMQRTPEDDRLLPHLVEGLLDEAARAECEEALVGSGPRALTALTQALDHESRHMRERAAKVISQFGPKAESTSPALVKLALRPIRSIYSEEYQPRSSALKALADIGARAVPAMIQCLEQGDSDVRRRTLDTLKDMGPVAVNASAAIENLLQNEDDEIRQHATAALKAVSAKQ